MFGHDNLHSTLVAWLKVILPLAALAILSTLFLVSRTIDPSDAIPFAEVDVQEYAREPRLTAPTWAGMTDDGASLTVSAAEARPGLAEARAPTATALRAVLDTPDGGKTELVADSGLLDQAAGALTVTGSVVVTTSTGWRVESEAMTARLDRTGVISPGPVTAKGPAGDLQAARMEITSDPERPGGYLMVFNGGVRLLYQPPDQEVLP
jgi:lipopolysaccharide export system protein LptC